MIAINSLGIGGTESYAFTVAEQFDRLGHGSAGSGEPTEALALYYESTLSRRLTRPVRSLGVSRRFR